MSIKNTLVALALVLPATAGPVLEGRGNRISSQRRYHLADDNGWFDHSKAARQVVRDHNKHRNNLINLEKNMGSEAFNEGSYITHFKETEPNQKRQASEALTDQHNDEYWSGNSEIGTPGQSFVLDFDTGSSDLWVISDKCTSEQCQGKHQYAANASSTSQPTTQNFTIRYGDGSSVEGPVYNETVVVAGLKVENQAFSPASVISPSFGHQDADGLMGLAYAKLSNISSSPFINTAKAQGVIRNAVFGFKLSKTDAELYIGGFDSSLYSGEIETHQVAGDTGYWQIGNGTLSVGDRLTASDIFTIIDSGTTLIYGPPDQVSDFYSAIPGAEPYDMSPGFWSYPCDEALPQVAFNWGGENWTISAESFNNGRISETRCIGSVLGVDLGLGKNTWLLGDSFMKNVYTAFSFEDDTVGFATLK